MGLLVSSCLRFARVIDLLHQLQILFYRLEPNLLATLIQQVGFDTRPRLEAAVDLLALGSIDLGAAAGNEDTVGQVSDVDRRNFTSSSSRSSWNL